MGDAAATAPAELDVAGVADVAGSASVRGASTIAASIRKMQAAARMRTAGGESRFKWFLRYCVGSGLTGADGPNLDGFGWVGGSGRDG